MRAACPVNFFLLDNISLESRVRATWRLPVYRQAPWDSRHSNFIFQMNTCGYSPYVTSFLRRGWVCRLQLLLILVSAVILRSESFGVHDHILLSQIRDSPNLENKIPIFISPRIRVAQLYPQALGSLLVASYDSQGYGGIIRPLLLLFRFSLVQIPSVVQGLHAYW
jgi:hypothetical protein